MAFSKGAGVAAERVMTKSGKYYSNAKWDAVDAVKSNMMSVDQFVENESDLPEEMKPMSKEERKNYITTNMKKREELTNKLNDLKVKRDKQIMDEKKKLSKSSSLDDAIVGAVKAQAATKKFTMDK